jgi:hypothetical protein
MINWSHTYRIADINFNYVFIIGEFNYLFRFIIFTAIETFENSVVSTHSLVNDELEEYVKKTVVVWNVLLSQKCPRNTGSIPDEVIGFLN